MTATEIVRGFYTATQAGDGVALLALLHPDFEAHTARETLERVWGPVFAAYDTAPYAETWHETADGLVVVTGHYRGKARATGRPYDAEFAHLWRVTDGRISWLHQYTDTARWREALR